MVVYSPVRIVPLGAALSTALEAQMVAQGPADIVAAKHAALLQDRYDLVGEGVELAREEGRHDVEAVGGAGPEPALQHIGDPLRRADQEEMAARRRDAVVELAQGEVLAPCHL